MFPKWFNSELNAFFFSNSYYLAKLLLFIATYICIKELLYNLLQGHLKINMNSISIAYIYTCTNFEKNFVYLNQGIGLRFPSIHTLPPG